MSARSRLGDVDAALQDSDTIEVKAEEYDPHLAMIEALLRALALAQAATAEAILEAGRGEAGRVAYPATPTRHAVGDADG